MALRRPHSPIRAPQTAIAMNGNEARVTTCWRQSVALFFRPKEGGPASIYWRMERRPFKPFISHRRITTVISSTSLPAAKWTTDVHRFRLLCHVPPRHSFGAKLAAGPKSPPVGPERSHWPSNDLGRGLEARESVGLIGHRQPHPVKNGTE